MKPPHQLISRRVYPSMFACWYPETNLTFFDLDEFAELRSLGPLLFVLMLFHEVIHSTEGASVSPSLGQFSGTVLNISDLAFKSVEDILKSKNANLEHVKRKILTREIAIDRLFLASRNVVEVMAAYQYKATIVPSFRVYNRMLTTNSALRALKTLKWKIPEDVVVNCARVLARRGPGDVQSWISFLEQNTNRFVEESLKNARRKTLFAKLSDIGNLVGSPDLPIFVCKLALDVPFHYDTLRWTTGLPLQFDPEKRLLILLEGVEKMVERAGKRANYVLMEWMKRARSFDMKREPDEPIGKERGIEYYDGLSTNTPKHLSFDCHAKELTLVEILGIRSEKDRRIFSNPHIVKSFLKKPRDMIGLFLEWGLLPVAAHTLNGHFRISFSPRYDCRFWKLGWYLNYLKDQVVSGVEPDLLVNPADTGYFVAPNHLRKELMEPTRLARRLAPVTVPESLWHRFANTSRQLDRVIPGK